MSDSDGGAPAGTTRFHDVYAGEFARRALPENRIPDEPSDPDAVYTLIHDELELDGNAEQNLATFCSTWAEPQVRKLMDENLAKNMIDKAEYPQTAAIEERCVTMLADLWHAPDAETAPGCSTTGSSEACMLGGLALKTRWRKARRAAGLPADKPNLVCGPVQVCWEKFARYFDVELRRIELLPGATGLRPEQLRAHVDENTIGVVAILGVTCTCDYEPVAAIAAELDAIQRDTGLDVPIHVDAASGGFVAPFIQPDLVWDFEVARVGAYMLLYAAAIRLRYTQPGLPRAFRIPGGKPGIWLVGGTGFLAFAFAFVLAFVPPAQLPIGGPGLYVGLVAVGAAT